MKVSSSDDREPAEIARQRGVTGDDLEAKRKCPQSRETERREAARVSRREIRRADALLDGDGGERAVGRREKPVSNAERGQPPPRIAANPGRSRRRRDRGREPSARDKCPRQSRSLRVLRVIPDEPE